MRALLSERTDEVAKNLIGIFCIFDAPSILQSDNGHEFANPLIEKLYFVFSDLKIVWKITP